jgi:SAM-dependent methyltransferase
MNIVEKIVSAGDRPIFDLDEFLARPLYAHLAVSSENGARESPVWFHWDGIALWIIGGTSFPRNLKRDPRSAIGIVDWNRHTGLSQHVGLRGRAEVLPFDADMARTIFRRYFGPDEGQWDPRFAFTGEPDLEMVRFIPETVVLRDQSYRVPRNPTPGARAGWAGQPALKPDFGATAQDYAAHRAGFPDSFFDRLAARGIGLPGQRVVDLGTGTGTLARGFAARGCDVLGIDPADPLLEEARKLSASAGLRVEFRSGTAESTGLPDASADVVAAGQCWHWFDRPAAAREAARVLKSAGLLLIAHFDWLPLRSNVVEATEALIQAHNPRWDMAGGNGLYPLWLRDLGEAGYRDIETCSYDVTVPYSREGWRGRIRASAGVAGSLPPEQVAAFDGALGQMLQERFPDSILEIPHRVFAVIGRPPHAG